jgi:hypothetical protein
LHAWSEAAQVRRALSALFLAYCALLIGPASQIYVQVDTWQDLPRIARAVQHDTANRPLILFAPDETTRAIIDLYARTEVGLIPGPIDAVATARLKAALAAAPQSVIAALLPGRADGIAQRLASRFRPHPSAMNGGDALPDWATAAQLQVLQRYSLPNGRRYALFESGQARPEQSAIK